MAEEIQEAVQIIRVAYDGIDIAVKIGSGMIGQIKEALDFMVGAEMTSIGHKENLKRLYDEILKKDWFMTLLDYKAYEEARERIYRDYEDSFAWAKKMLVNISKAGYFSSDRTILEYNRDIWKLN